MAYGSNSTAQILAFKTVNSQLDQQTTEYRITATQIINTMIDAQYEITNPSDKIHTACNLLTAAMLRTKSGEASEDSYWKQALFIIEKLRGDNQEDGRWGNVLRVARF